MHIIIILLGVAELIKLKSLLLYSERELSDELNNRCEDQSSTVLCLVNVCHIKGATIFSHEKITPTVCNLTTGFRSSRNEVADGEYVVGPHGECNCPRSEHIPVA